MPKARQGLERVDALFVQSAASLTSDGETVTLHGLADATIFLVSRRLREIGHLSSRRFVELWAEDAASESAVVSFVDAVEGGAPPPDALVALSAPRLDGDDLTYEVEVLEGSLPREAGACTVFIDALRRPLARVSVGRDLARADS